MAVIKPGSVRNLRKQLENSGLGAGTNNLVACAAAERRRPESAIRSIHEEIVNTLQLIVQQTEEIHQKLSARTSIDTATMVKMKEEEVRVLTLSHGEHRDTDLFRMENGWQLQFRLGPTLLGKRVALFCNYPKDGGDFKRNRYVQLHWTADGDAAAPATHPIRANVSGSFHYYFAYEDEKKRRQGSGYFIVDPRLTFGDVGETLPLDAIQCQTVLAKSLGNFASWEAKLRVTKESGYNMIHFTPIQELGASRSSYSLCDQHKLNPQFGADYQQVEQFLDKIRTEWKITSICDIVLNHTANESGWLLEHPEATYNCSNCPYMRPAYLLDAALHLFSLDVARGSFESKGIPPEGISTEEHLQAIRYVLENEVIDSLRLEEMFVCDVKTLVAEFADMARGRVPRMMNELDVDQRLLRLIQDPDYRRLATRVDMDLALRIYNVYRGDCFDEESRIRRCTEEFKLALDGLNVEVANELRDHLTAAVDNCIAGIRYFRVQKDGPGIREVSERFPLVYRYFTTGDIRCCSTLKECERTMYENDGGGKYLMVHNGWVMNADPLQNFAADSRVYLRRELIAWSDSVKLRYGERPEDCPFLWQHMREYVETMARMFDGVRLDNCHSTPMPVAEYLLDCARKVKPELYVVAELFTNSDRKDNIFVNRLGINSLIREAMSAWDSNELGRQVHRFGGDPVGAFYQPHVRPLTPSVAHALFLDLTHDNPCPIEKRSVYDILPNAALVSMACCAIGSSRGYDELIPHHVHVVDETREYAEWWSSKEEKLEEEEEQKTVNDDDDDYDDRRFVSASSGIVAAKRALNELHSYLARNGFNQVFVDQMDADVVAVTRHNPNNHESVILVAYTDFNDATSTRDVKPLSIDGEVREIILEASLKTRDFDVDAAAYVRDDKYINGLRNYELQIERNLPLEKSRFLRKSASEPYRLQFKNFTRGCVVAIRVGLLAEAEMAVRELRRELIDDNSVRNELTEIVSSLDLADYNRVLYRCDQEERDEGFGFGAYDIPSYGPTVYCGLQGFISPLSEIRPSNDLGHPMCSNLRSGDWMIDYVSDRLKLDEGTEKLGKWLERRMRPLKQLPRYLIPAYFDALLTGLYTALLENCFDQLMSCDFVRDGSSFVRALALGSVQMVACIKSAPLPMPSPPPSSSEQDARCKAMTSLSAGLPHFAVGYMRNWGRDTFISIRGLLILTGRRQEARQHILAYAACLRHGLIPNLLDAATVGGGVNARYNCRDAVWWWLYCIRSYVQECDAAADIFGENVVRLFPATEEEEEEGQDVRKSMTLGDVMQEALNVHFQGLAFRERNAGRTIDEHMSDRGFNNQIGVHPETGFVFGGNDANCGTWMDKMGSSERTGNRGKPATPRDGSAVELVGLSMAVVAWLHTMHKQGLYKYEGVQRRHKPDGKLIIRWSWQEWADRIAGHFEKSFWIGPKTEEEEEETEDNHRLINKRNMYKDCFGATQTWSDYQLRCNYPIAMVAAPELFDPQHAWAALRTAEEHLLGPLGMKTLDASDWNYVGDYDNSDESQGYNYHQGPEWVWPVGYFLRARLIFAAKLGFLRPTVAHTKEILSRHLIELQTSPWRGLPELTNSNGAFCKDSSATQAWSMASIMEVLYDVQQIESKSPINLN